MEERFEYMEHTADAKFKAFGKSLDEKFSNCAYAMFNIIVDTNKVDEVDEHKIKLQAKSIRGLLYDFLDELLFLHETADFVISQIVSIKVNEEDFSVEATITGDSYKNYETVGHVKAVTYNDFELADDYVIMVMDL